MCSRSKFLWRSLSSKVLLSPSGSLKNGNGGSVAALSGTLDGSNSALVATGASVALAVSGVGAGAGTSGAVVATGAATSTTGVSGAFAHADKASAERTTAIRNGRCGMVVPDVRWLTA